MLSLREGAVRRLADIARMGKVDMRREPRGHRRYIILRARAERAGAEGDAVGG